ncbi:MAG TPA: mismatch-specific DNA-glycosylase [Nocardiopsis listeri]|uniref:mismatch-specific DNA-glycosylase n=1 Tax=Nocardiopsis listeri TaxID=53440 RepID=UPI001DAFB084|nr:mismatch-specific DNA-glycosylase [Nocardiopsis listeri]HJE61790.1 mismatch-specific DNA-glycosylase [Nocardiopsis listeri]
MASEAEGGPTRGSVGRAEKELEAGRDLLLPDVLDEGLSVVFRRLDPGLTSAVRGHHFATPGNRFWPAPGRSGFTPGLRTPDRDRELPRLGLGFTNLVARTTRGSDELAPEGFVEGARELRGKFLALGPSWPAFLGITGYRAAFGVRRPKVGPQEESIGRTRLWPLPNPSGRNAHYTPAMLAEEFVRLRVAAGLPDRSTGADSP